MKTFISIALIILAIPLYAQDDDLPEESNATVRERIQAARVAYITDQLALTPTEAEKFWPIYREFTDKRKALLKELRYARRHPDPVQWPPHSVLHGLLPRKSAGQYECGGQLILAQEVKPGAHSLRKT